MHRIDWLVALMALFVGGAGAAAMGACSPTVDDCTQSPHSGCPGAGGGTSGACSTATACTDVTACQAQSTACILTSCTKGCCDSTFAPAATLCADSGGVVCDGTGKCVACLETSNCATGTVCAIPTCNTAAHTCSTTSVALGTPCADSGGTVCNGAGKCVPAHCTDGIEDGDESDVDCGGATCPGCSTGQKCAEPTDCHSDVCTAGTTPHTCAAPTCSDGVKNGLETGVDCGGPLCATCPDGQACMSGTDCKSSFCSTAMLCSSRPNGTVCSAGADCLDGSCVDNGTGANICCASPCATGYACVADGSMCNTICTLDTQCTAGYYCVPTAGTTGGTCQPRLGTTKPCASASECASGFCVDNGTGASICCLTACGNTYACDPTSGSCNTSCTTNGECVAGSYCAGNACVGKKGLGQQCLAGTECSSGDCVDDGAGSDVCCSTPACANNVACNPANGQCYPAPCLSDADCTKSAYCGPTGSCLTRLTQGQACTAADQCQSGACVPGGASGNVCCQSACGGNLACNPSSGSCYASCVADTSCVPGTYCAAGTCVGKKSTGGPCVAGDQCVSGTCTAGLCG